MFCGECGTQNPDTNSFCKNCGKPLKRAPAPSHSAPAPVQAPTVAVLSSPVPEQAAPSEPVKKPGWNWLAIISLAISFLSWIVYPYICGIIAIIIGGAALWLGRKQTGKISFIAVAAILIALGSMFLDFFYAGFFAPHLLPGKE
jgi:hypothetical protein